MIVAKRDKWIYKTKNKTNLVGVPYSNKAPQDLHFGLSCSYLPKNQKEKKNLCLIINLFIFFKEKKNKKFIIFMLNIYLNEAILISG